eukprot:PhF_6_TR26388/c0_g1_i1/m.38081
MPPQTDKTTFLGLFAAMVRSRGRDTHHLDGLEGIIAEALKPSRRFSKTVGLRNSTSNLLLHSSACEDCDETEFLQTCMDGDMEAFYAILNNNQELDLNCQDDNGSTALHIATFNGQVQIVRELLSLRETRKVDLNVRDELGYTALMIAVQSAKSQCMDLLTQAGAAVNLRTQKGCVALHYAILNRDERMVVRLLAKGGPQRFARAELFDKHPPMTPYELVRFLYMEEMAHTMMEMWNKSEGVASSTNGTEEYDTDEEEDNDGGNVHTFVNDRRMTDAQIKGVASAVVELCMNDGNTLETVKVEAALRDLGFDPTTSDIKALLVEVDRSYDVHVSKCDVVRPRGSPIHSAELLLPLANAVPTGIKLVPHLLSLASEQSASAAAKYLWDLKADNFVGDFIGDPVISFNPTGKVVSGIFHFSKVLENLGVPWHADTSMLLLARSMGGGTMILLLVVNATTFVYMIVIEEVIISLMDAGLKPLNLDEAISFALESGSQGLGELIMRGLPELTESLFESYKKRIVVRINSFSMMTQDRKKLLYHAVVEGDMKLTHLLLRVDSSVVHSMPELLVTACVKNFSTIVQELLQAGAPVDALDPASGETPLTACVRSDSSIILTTLLQYKANVDIPDSQGNTPLNLACALQHSACALQLIRRDANPNIMGPNENSPLLNAVMTGDEQLVFHLLNNRAEKYVENKFCMTPFIAAVLTAPNLCPSLMRPDVQIIAPPDCSFALVKKMHLITVTVINICRMFFTPEDPMYPPLETVRAPLEGSITSVYPEQKTYLPYIQAQLMIARRVIASLLVMQWNNLDDEIGFLVTSLDHSCERFHESLQNSEYGTRFPEGVQECVTLSTNIALRAQRLAVLQEFQPLQLFHLCGIRSTEYVVWINTVGRNTICASRVGPFLHTLQTFCNFPALRYGWRQRAVSDFVDPSGSCWITIAEFSLLCKMFPIANHGLEDLCSIAATGAFDPHIPSILIPNRITTPGDFIVCVDSVNLIFLIRVMTEDREIITLDVQSSMLGYWRVGSAQGKTFVEALENSSHICKTPKGKSYNVEGN